jgi:hypothetical protein
MAVCPVAVWSVGLLTLLLLWPQAAEAAIATDRFSLPNGTGRLEGPGESPQVITRVYSLKYAKAQPVVVFLRSLFIVVNQQEPYVRFHFQTQSEIPGRQSRTRPGPVWFR